MTLSCKSVDCKGDKQKENNPCFSKQDYKFLIVASSDQMSVMLPQAQSWVDLAHSDDGDHELNFESFVKAVGKSIGKIGKFQRYE